MSSDSPWRTVLALVERFEEALVLMALFEYRDTELLANGSSTSELFGHPESERSFAQLLADRMTEREGGDWSYTDFYGPSRGALEPTADETDAFVKRCAEAGVRLHYDDGTDAVGRV